MESTKPVPEVSDFDRHHVAYVLREGTWFSADLFRLIEHADVPNRERLRLAFPNHVAAFEAFVRGEEQEPWPPR